MATSPRPSSAHTRNLVITRPAHGTPTVTPTVTPADNWAGGNHFARNAGSSMVNVYYWKAPIAADNLKQGAERQHMARAYAAIALAAGDILGTAAQLRHQKNVTITIAPGRQHVASAYVYGAAAFLENPSMAGSAVHAFSPTPRPSFSVPLPSRRGQSQLVRPVCPVRLVQCG